MIKCDITKAKSKILHELRGSLKPGKGQDKITAETTYGKKIRIGLSTAPKKRHSPNQETWRDKFKACIATWHTLTPAQKEPYEETGKSLNLTGYQVYISECLLATMATEVIQSDKTKLHATVHIDGTDNAISGTISVSGDVEVVQPTAADLKATVTQHEKDRTITNDVEVVQPTAADLKATVTQAEKDRTVTGTVTAKRGVPDYTEVFKDGHYTTQQTDAILWDPAAGKKFVITDILISTDTKMDIHLEDGTTKKFGFHFGVDGGCSSNFQTPYKSTAADNNLTITTSAAGKVDIEVFGYEV